MLVGSNNGRITNIRLESTTQATDSQKKIEQPPLTTTSQQVQVDVQNIGTPFAMESQISTIADSEIFPL